MSRPKDEMHRAIDVLAKAMPNGQLMAAMGPLAFLGSAAEHIKSLGAEVERLRGELAAETASADAEHANLVRVADKYRSREDDIVRALAAERQARELLGRIWGRDMRHATGCICVDCEDYRVLLDAPGTPEPATTPDTGEGTR